MSKAERMQQLRASMGPQQRCCGIGARGLQTLNTLDASMGPQQRCCGIGAPGRRRLARRFRFNGAAAALLRNCIGGLGLALALAQLQWGRSSAAAEFCFNPGGIGTAYLLQWGRSSAAAELSRFPAGRLPNLSFNGAAAALLRNCGTIINVELFRKIASMGPQQRCCGIPQELSEARAKLELQWGRSSAAAELAPCSAVTTRTSTLQWGRSSAAAELAAE